MASKSILKSWNSGSQPGSPFTMEACFGELILGQQKPLQKGMYIEGVGQMAAMV